MNKILKQWRETHFVATYDKKPVTKNFIFIFIIKVL